VVLFSLITPNYLHMLCKWQKILGQEDGVTCDRLLFTSESVGDFLFEIFFLDYRFVW